MKIRPTKDGIEFRSTPGCLWGFGLWFVAGGTLGLAMVAFAPGELTLRDRLIAALIGAGVLAGGLYAMSTWPATRLTMNMVNRTLRYVRTAPLRRRVVVDAPFDRFDGVQVTPSRDSDGDVWYELLLRIEGAAPLTLGSWPDAQRSELDAASAAISAALRGSRTRVRSDS